jgi:membrane protein DedA with SNARE-associated domain
MDELETALRYVVIIVATVVAMLVGDYLGYKIGRWKLAWIAGSIGLLSIISFFIYAIVVDFA